MFAFEIDLSLDRIPPFKVWPRYDNCFLLFFIWYTLLQPKRH